MNERRWSKYSYTFKKPVPNSFLGIPVFQTGLEVFEEPLMMQQNVWDLQNIGVTYLERKNPVSESQRQQQWVWQIRIKTKTTMTTVIGYICTNKTARFLELPLINCVVLHDLVWYCYWYWYCSSDPEWMVWHWCWNDWNSEKLGCCCVVLDTKAKQARPVAVSLIGASLFELTFSLKSGFFSSFFRSKL